MPTPSFTRTITQFLLLGLLLIAFHGHAQSEKKKVDSLQKILNAMPEDTNKVITLIDLGNLLYKQDLDKGLDHYEAAFALAERLKYPRGMGRASIKIGLIYYLRSDYDKAIQEWKKSTEYGDVAGDRQTSANAANNIGAVNKSLGNYTEALIYYQKAIEIFKSLNDSMGLASNYNNTANIYKVQGSYKKALENYFSSLRIHDERKDSVSIAKLYNNIGIVYDEMQDYPSALENYNNSLKIREAMGDKTEIANSLFNIGALYGEMDSLDLALNTLFRSLNIAAEVGRKDGIATAYEEIGRVFKKQRDYTKASDNYTQSLRIRQEIGDQEGVAQCYINFGELNLAKGDKSAAIDNLEKGLAMARDIGVAAQIHRASELLSTLYQEKGDYQKAFEMHVLFKSMEDSLNSSENVKQFTQLQMQYEFDKKQKQIELEQIQTQANLKRQKLIQRFLLFGIAFLLVLAFLVYRSYRIKQKANLEITEQKEEIERQKFIVERKNMDITSSINYAKRIQEAILVGKEELDRMLPRHFIFYKPKDIVSGDFYWAHAPQPDEVIFAVADCTGHGVPGAFMSMIGNSLLNEIIIEAKITNPAEILNSLRKQIIRSLGQKGEEGEAQDGMDIALCRWNKTKNELVFAGANNGVYLLRKGELSIIKGDRQPLGIYVLGKEKAFTNHVIPVQKEDMVYLLSDGYVDQFGGDNDKKFNSKRLRELLVEIHAAPVQEQRQIMEETIMAWKEGYDQIDDMCVFGVRIVGSA